MPKSCNKINQLISQRNKFWYWEIFVEVLDEFPSYFIQSQTSTRNPESNHPNKYFMLLSNLWDEHGGLSQFSEAGCRHKLALVSPVVMSAPPAD